MHSLKPKIKIADIYGVSICAQSRIYMGCMNGRNATHKAIDNRQGQRGKIISIIRKKYQELSRNSTHNGLLHSMIKHLNLMKPVESTHNSRFFGKKYSSENIQSKNIANIKSHIHIRVFQIQERQKNHRSPGWNQKWARKK